MHNLCFAPAPQTRLVQDTCRRTWRINAGPECCSMPNVPNATAPHAWVCFVNRRVAGRLQITATSLPGLTCVSHPEARFLEVARVTKAVSEVQWADGPQQLVSWARGREGRAGAGGGRGFHVCHSRRRVDTAIPGRNQHRPVPPAVILDVHAKMSGIAVVGSCRRYARFRLPQFCTPRPRESLEGGGLPPLPLPHCTDSTPKGFPYPNTSPNRISNRQKPPPPTAFTSPVTAVQPLWDCTDGPSPLQAKPCPAPVSCGCSCLCTAADEETAAGCRRFAAKLRKIAAEKKCGSVTGCQASSADAAQSSAAGQRLACAVKCLSCAHRGPHKHYSKSGIQGTLGPAGHGSTLRVGARAVLHPHDVAPSPRVLRGLSPPPSLLALA